MIKYGNPYSIDRAHYSNLPHGEYKFLLQVSTDRGYSWSTPEKSIGISILPPWWLTGWAKTLYIIVFTLIITTFGYQYHQEQKLKREKHIQEIQRVNESIENAFFHEHLSRIKNAAYTDYVGCRTDGRIKFIQGMYDHIIQFPKNVITNYRTGRY